MSNTFDALHDPKYLPDYTLRPWVYYVGFSSMGIAGSIRQNIRNSESNSDEE